MKKAAGWGNPLPPPACQKLCRVRKSSHACSDKAGRRETVRLQAVPAENSSRDCVRATLCGHRGSWWGSSLVVGDLSPGKRTEGAHYEPLPQDIERILFIFSTPKQVCFGECKWHDGGQPGLNCSFSTWKAVIMNCMHDMHHKGRKYVGVGLRTYRCRATTEGRPYAAVGQVVFRE